MWRLAVEGVELEEGCDGEEGGGPDGHGVAVLLQRLEQRLVALEERLDVREDGVTFLPAAEAGG